MPHTITKGTRWQLSRQTRDGHERYPDVIEVGVGSQLVVSYEPRYAARKMKVERYEGMGHYECGVCRASVRTGDRYCHRCGARFEEG